MLITRLLPALLLPASAIAQRQGPPRPVPAVPTALPAYAIQPAITAPMFKALRWRNVGPMRGGRVDAVTGDPTRPLVFYFGAVNGGVWKTTNGGLRWRNITDDRTDISSVGAIALAPSDPNVLYVGTGESQLREDLTYGTGVYRSTDGGDTWTHLGLTDSHQITAVRVDPGDPDRVFVAALGHAFGPNPERGVFRSTDGGKTWKKILFLDDSTGAADLSMDPTNPRILFASMWRFRRMPWGMDAGGGRSGLFKSTDGGETWIELTRHTGMPAGPIGKIGVAISPANPRRIYASVEAKDSAGGIFRSDDGGETWQRMNGEQKFAVRPWYYSAVTADPVNENTVYVMNLTVWRSIDGGKTFERIRMPHGDTHIMWVDPKDPKRLINGNDGGATISYDGGESWSSIMNQPTAQFYHVTTDNQFPYRIYGAQQDNSTVSIASRSDHGGITERDWWPVAGCENAYIAIDPRDPEVTYGGCYTGIFMRYDRRTGQTRDLSVWLSNYDGWAARDIPNRFQWTFPVLISSHDPRTLYITSQHVWRTTTDGQSWEKISGDLTRHDSSTLGASGGPVTKDMTGTEWYATIFAFAESPLTRGLLWTGSDDGLVQLSRDGGATWTNVTPPATMLGPFTRISVIEPGHFDAGTAYVAGNRYQQDDFRPYLLRTTDYGKTWTPITTGIPAGAYTRAIREDPIRRGLLFAGTETGVYVSFDDGARWGSLQQNLPRSSVRDLHIHENDLIAATHGRAFWVLDDISILRQVADSVRVKPRHLFQPANAIRFAGGGGSGDGVGSNPPSGVIVDYYLREKPSATLSLEFLDGNRRVIRTFTSESDSAKKAADSTAAKAGAPAASGVRTDSVRADLLPGAVGIRRAELRDTVAHAAGDSVLPARPGTNRFVWNLRYPGARQLKGVVNDEGTFDGPVAPPGAYVVRLIAGTDTLERPFIVVPDPRLKTTAAEYAQLFALAIQVRDRISDITDASGRIADVQQQLDARVTQTKGQPYAARVADAAKPLRQKLEVVRGALMEVASHVDQSTLNYPIKLYNMMVTLNAQVQGADAVPTRQHGEIFVDLSAQVGDQLQKMKTIEDADLAAFNTLLKELNVPAVLPLVPRKPNVAM